MGTTNAVLYQKYSFTSLVNLSGRKLYETVGITDKPGIKSNNWGIKGIGDQ
jgi:hypothetical protein